MYLQLLLFVERSVFCLGNKKVSDPAMKRYPIYLKALKELKNDGLPRVQSKELAMLTGIDATTIRRDLMMLGKLGTKGKGYNVVRLSNYLSKQLGLASNEQLILVGTGKLGLALLNYNTWNDIVGGIVCAFDEKPGKVKKKVEVPVYSIREMKKKMPKDCRIAILCTSKNTQKIVNQLADNGIIGIINYTMEHFTTPAGVIVRNVDIVSDIQSLVIKLDRLELEKEQSEDLPDGEKERNDQPKKGDGSETVS